MKREELTELGLAAEAVDKVMALHGRDVEKHKTAAQEWQQRYETETGALRAQTEETVYQTVAENALRDMHFSSESAKKTFAAELKAARLPVEGGSLRGMEHFVEQYRTQDPAAFRSEENAKAPVIAPVAVKAAGGVQGSVRDEMLRRAFGL